MGVQGASYSPLVLAPPTATDMRPRPYEGVRRRLDPSRLLVGLWLRLWLCIGVELSLCVCAGVGLAWLLF